MSGFILVFRPPPDVEVFKEGGRFAVAVRHGYVTVTSYVNEGENLLSDLLDAAFSAVDSLIRREAVS